ncbi:Tetratricopeptide repeat (TPR)-like superfamily protein [Tripterygium wilfordii]|uniref:Tetratricopeptide repeat (TPR)-like superfamily protein n=1 Tax=Tripterygium wilfordii TaxID=458696 RepID=A0A7J7D6X5_TRIWF|nr:tetratricopeptide repeat protein 1-like [Tripterygium wilfordii]KAF5742107.1 Tetratricopeptide repeat (TPR)-like superfamily protein [Tripterygium wilfordii]
MVLIEPEENEETNANVINPPKPRNPSSSTATKTTDSSDDSTAAASATVNGDASDGFETASERDVSDNEDGDAKEAKGNPEDQQQRQHEEQSKDDSSGNLANEDELKQKALAQANDAKLEGNKLFGDGQYEGALSQYELALQVAPEMPSSVELRSMCHSNRAICFVKLGKYEDAIKECTKALELNPTYMKALIRRGEAHEKLEHYEEAISDMKKILELDPLNEQARRTIRRLEPLAAEKREKMKEEMIGKLKDLGNSVLGRFGMSVDNFKAVKDPNTGSYSVQFQR